MTDKRQELTAEDIQRETAARTEKYKTLNFFENYAMYMGIAQLLEICLKRLLIERHGFTIEETEKWTLGKTCSELKRKEVREDFTSLLDSVVKSRNYIAHELLANEFTIHEILKDNIPEDHYSRNFRALHKAIIELEQLNFLFEWTEENNGWN